MGTTVSFNRPDGQSVQGYLAEPAAPQGAPAVVVIQEWWGLNDQIRGVADRLAQAGYRALGPARGSGGHRRLFGERGVGLCHRHRHPGGRRLFGAGLTCLTCQTCLTCSSVAFPSARGGW